MSWVEPGATYVLSHPEAPAPQERIIEDASEARSWIANGWEIRPL